MTMRSFLYHPGLLSLVVVAIVILIGVSPSLSSLVSPPPPPLSNIKELHSRNVRNNPIPTSRKHTWGELKGTSETHAFAQALPVVQMEIDAHIVDFLGKVVITQHFENSNDFLVSGSFSMPLDDQSSVCGFRATIGNVTVEGAVEERHRAKRMYNEAVAQGHSAFMLESQTAEIFTLSIGNIPAGSVAVVRIEYVTQLSLVQGARTVQFMLPSTDIHKRYSPQGETTTGCTTQQTCTPNLPPVASSRSLKVTIDIDMPDDIETISSSSHPLFVVEDPNYHHRSVTKTEQEEDDDILLPPPPHHHAHILHIKGNHATVSLLDTSLKNDFLLDIVRPAPHEPQMWIETHPTEKTHVALLSYAVRNLEVAQKDLSLSEIIFLVDTSGSMSGANMDAARSSLRQFISFVPKGVWFNMIRFSSGHSWYNSASSVVFTDETFSSAKQWVDDLFANGGTEIGLALDEVFSMRLPCDECTRNVIVLTDGEVHNTNHVIKEAFEKSNGARIFTLGIGSDVSHDLVNGLARIGNGVAEYARADQDISPMVMRQAARALSGQFLENVQISWNNEREASPKLDKEVTSPFLIGKAQVPQFLPPLFDQVTLLAYKFFNEEEDIFGKSNIVSLSANGGWARDLPQSSVVYLEDDTLHKLAVRGRVRNLEDLYDARSMPSSIQQEIISLSKQYNISSSLTAFISIIKNEEGSTSNSPSSPSSPSPTIATEENISTITSLSTNARLYSASAAAVGGTKASSLNSATTSALNSAMASTSTKKSPLDENYIPQNSRTFQKHAPAPNGPEKASPPPPRTHHASPATPAPPPSRPAPPSSGAHHDAGTPAPPSYHSRAFNFLKFTTSSATPSSPPAMMHVVLWLVTLLAIMY
eukprot:TRINITY_DN2082_c0_g1_i2.p1 TRINITY_DN2082_c0_g1~~TRINITY_DN2082_c0_g1_i2.p1  ORF type:complete len:872 (-),score=202.67 TRINITY_DN2082_c0_g1_i2:64-2679(-)